MSNPEAAQFLGAIAPFDRLERDDFARAVDSLTSASYTPGETIIDRLTNPGSLHLVARGVVEELDQAGPVAIYTAGACFDSMGLINGRSENNFVSRDRSTCWLLPSQLFQALIRRDARFRDHFLKEVSRRVDGLVAVQQQREASSFLLARLGEGHLHAPVFVGPETTIKEATRLMRAREVSAVLVRRDAELGIFTERDVRERSVLMGIPDSTPIGDLASYELYSLDREDFLFNALVLMTERAIRHVVVTRNGEVEGVFEQSDLLGYLSNSSYVIASRVDRATTRAELQAAGAAVPRLIGSLFHRGVKPRYIARIVTDLNRKVFRKVFDEVAEPGLRAASCLMVMGSEGRGEQLLRTDQDNGLIFADQAMNGERAATGAAFTQALIELGYPPCPGNVMVSNAEWAKPLADYRREMRSWIGSADGDAMLKLAILYDATPIAGDAGLLTDIKAYLFELVGREDAFAGHFARATLAFPTPLGLFNRFVLEDGPDDSRRLDIKKGGIFPIVHGVRSLALEYRVTETNTISRIQALSGRGPFSEDFTADLIEAFDFMAMLRLREQLSALDQGLPYDNSIDVPRLRSFERNLLRDSLKIVKQFKADVSSHFRLAMLG